MNIQARCYTVLVSLYCWLPLAYAKEKVDDWVLGDVIKRESIDESVSRIETVDLVAFCNYVWNKEYNMKLAKAIKLKFPKCRISFGGPQTTEEYLVFSDHTCPN